MVTSDFWFILLLKQFRLQIILMPKSTVFVLFGVYLNIKFSSFSVSTESTFFNESIHNAVIITNKFRIMEKGPTSWQHKQLQVECGRSLFLQSSHLQRLLIDWIMPPASDQLSGNSLFPSLFSFLPFHSRTNFLSISYAKYLSLHFGCLAYEYFCQLALTFCLKIFPPKYSYFPRGISCLLLRCHYSTLLLYPIILLALLGQTSHIIFSLFLMLCTNQFLLRLIDGGNI